MFSTHNMSSGGSPKMNNAYRAENRSAANAIVGMLSNGSVARGGRVRKKRVSFWTKVQFFHVLYVWRLTNIVEELKDEGLRTNVPVFYLCNLRIRLCRYETHDSIIHSFIHSIIQSIIHSFIHSFIQASKRSRSCNYSPYHDLLTVWTRNSFVDGEY